MKVSSWLFCLMLLCGTAHGDKLNVQREKCIHFDQRPTGIAIDTIVLHASERNSLEELTTIFNHKDFPVSAHYAIDKQGKIIQYLDDSLRAWHAGQSKNLDGREHVNDFSIGIELINKNDGLDPYPDKQVLSLRALISELLQRHPISLLTTHRRIAFPLGRKTDPRSFPFKNLGSFQNLKIVP